MKKIIASLAFASMVAVSAFSATTIKLGYSTNSSDPRGVASKLFKEEVEKNSKGNIKVEIYDSAKLGSDTQLIEGVINGTVDMTVSSAGNFGVYATNIGVSALPFLFTDFNKAWKFMDSQIVADVNKELEATNIVVLAHYDNGFRCVTTTNKPVNKVADMKGLHIRTPANQIVMETMMALGAKPEPLDFGKLPAALKAGQFDSQENPIPVIYNNKLYEVQKYLSVTNHSYDAMPLVIRKDLWKKFSAADQKIIKDAALKAQKLNRSIVKEQTESLVKDLKAKGMTVTTPNLKEFATATQSVLDMFADVYGKDLMNKVKAFK
ncbi:MAG: TRAP transporter substrate-binding protein [Treponema sp.]|nr:TRAP transporter substrate-binding protein [Treponema sp.]MBR4631061.1 TRAP transporter substrate-binding protein [Treponema sp.]MBR6912189.1 TRAP transporter substrate-binding protein [Treponema sp.]